MDITGKSQDEVVAILRNTKRGSTVTLCVSRMEAGDMSSLPRQIVCNYLPCHHCSTSPLRSQLLAHYNDQLL